MVECASVAVDARAADAAAAENWRDITAADVTEAAVAAALSTSTAVGWCRLTPGWPWVDRVWFQRLKLKYDDEAL